MWPPWIPYVQVCPVNAPSGRVVLSILTVRIDLAVAAQVPSSRPIPFPRAVVLDERGLPIGELASAVPDEKPFGTEVIFSDWRNDFPHRVDVRRINQAVSGTYNEKPLVWNAGSRRYE